MTTATPEQLADQVEKSSDLDELLELFEEARAMRNDLHDVLMRADTLKTGLSAICRKLTDIRARVTEANQREIGRVA